MPAGEPPWKSARNHASDYPDFAKKGIEKVLENPRNVGIFICGTGLGMSMAANRNPKIRAALCLSASYAKYARAKNDANVLVLSGDNCKIKKAIQIIKTFLTTDFEAGEGSKDDKYNFSYHRRHKRKQRFF